MRLKTKHFHILMIILLAFMLYFNTFFNPFVFDDPFFIVDNFEIRSLKNIPSYFSEPSAGNLYRPLRTVLYSVTFFIWRLNPFGYHLNAVLLHTFVAITVYFIVFEIIGDRRFALIASLLFVAHPIHTARVANMTAGFDLLGVLFLFWAFYNYVIFRKYDKRRAFVYSVVLSTLGLFSSEEVIVFPILALLFDFCFIDGKGIFNVRNLKSKVRYFWIYIVSLLFYLMVRFFVLRQIGRADVYFFGDFGTRILSTSIIFLRYIFILILPLRLTVEYNVVMYPSFFSLSIIAALFIYLLIVFFWVRLYKNHKVAFFSIGWFFMALLPFSNILSVYTFMADRYLYVSSFGFLLLLAYLLDKFFHLEFFTKHRSKMFFLAIIFLLLFYSSLTIVRNSEWESDYVLLTKAEERQPKSSLVHNDLGQFYQENGLYDKAFEYYKKAIRLNNRNHIALLNLGSLYGEIGNYSLAMYYLNKSLSIRESYKAYNNLGLVYDKMDKQEEAVIELKKAIEFDPSLTKAYMDLGVVYAKIGQFDMAFEEFNKALEINPEIADIHYNLGILYEFLNETSRARNEFMIAYRLEPEDAVYRGMFLKYK